MQSQFNDIKLVSNHFCICWRILLASFLKFIGSGFEMMKLVSSANKTILLLLPVREGRSFMYKRKSKGPVSIPGEHHGLFCPILRPNSSGYCLKQPSGIYSVGRCLLKNPPVTS